MQMPMEGIGGTASKRSSQRENYRPVDGLSAHAITWGKGRIFSEHEKKVQAKEMDNYYFPLMFAGNVDH